MICPRCRSTMIVVEYQKVELDHCPDCSGVWFDAGELELMLERIGLGSGVMSVTSLMAYPEVRAAEKGRRCPVGGERMRKINLGEKPKVLIDLCHKGHGLFFDGGELSEVVRQCAEKECLGSEAERRILGFLGETFKAKVAKE